MEGTRNGREYRQEIENTTNVRKRKAEKHVNEAYLIDPDCSKRYEEWREEDDQNMLPFNILAKCAAKELKHLTKNKPKKGYKSDGMSTMSEKDSDIEDIEFPYSISGDKKLYRCTFEGCGKEFPSLSRMRRHYIIHTGAKPFKCLNAKCTKSFSRRDNMIQHYKGHCTHTKM
ncbi:hypothetical protein NEPAR06_1699 [Nematocida parisii]|uniref:C2H2-type domain-containing protein n=1 Tax=Nematocida parisii (strain ERTm3) TaxID=935791 RepID=I3EHG5_NEMP3|nr:uncharacterized protein NEPG_00439 [Nematocida parisii ERTm1]EIJ88662.1 hypothetical protein NEQG_01352 [Nematocida parisii ERTm3]KAI5130010.1 hypothetical protein NEPAR03_1914 [Nematocida parisii]EIJ94914.1 hypothetical protein NEPG_00439 [Nematocida parisii ERTm1]KAI5130321.1 hypothetical protein NEPAR08_1976 [Nematocida parisii]KAI5143320.1 hypothetical protein NEPAR04_1792 [Nematocida parisii]|eukprot:XP_013058270.1 hypothetical protein NEPG_00439 [Nematocida parisii ERTm1]